MATGSTENYSFPYPLSTDPVNVSGDIEQLAVKIDNELQEIIEDTSALMWTTGGTFSNGLQAPTYNDSSGKMNMSLSQDLQTSASPTFVNLTLTGDASINGGDLNTTQTTFNLINTTATTLNIGGSASVIAVGASVSQINAAGDMNVASGKVYKINNTQVLSSTTLGSAVVNSSLTSVGTVATGTWNATTIAVNRGGTGLTSYAIGDIVYASASTTLAKVAIGSNNTVLTSDGSAPVWTTNTGTGNVVRAASPTLSGTPLSTTASADTNTTQIATTAFVVGQAGSASPTMNGVVAVGTSLRYSRQDHVHPIDTSRAPVASPTFTGTISSTGTQIIMSSSASGSATEDVFFTVERGSDTDVSIRWNETGDAWQFTNDGTTFIDIGSGGGGGIGLESVLMFAGM
jgi:hypothetical protein